MATGRLVAIAVALGLVAGCADLGRLETDSLCPAGGGNDDDDDRGSQGSGAGVGQARVCSSFDRRLSFALDDEEAGEGARVRIDEDFAYRGGGSLHLAAPHTLNRRQAQVFYRDAGPGSRPLDWTRVFVNIPDVAAFRSSLIVNLNPTAPSQGVVVSLVEDGRLRVASGSATGFAEKVSEVRLRDGEWACLEIDVTAGAPVTLWVDGVEVPDVAPAAELVAPDLKVLGLGMDHQESEGPPAEAWFDELLVTDERAGCDR
jgi:hypothetical protein